MNMDIQLVMACLSILMIESPFHMFKCCDGRAVPLQMVRVSFKARFNPILHELLLFPVLTADTLLSLFFSLFQ